MDVPTPGQTSFAAGLGSAAFASAGVNLVCDYLSSRGLVVPPNDRAYLMTVLYGIVHWVVVMKLIPMPKAPTGG